MIMQPAVSILNMANELTDDQLRALRDRVYGQAISDNGWANVKDHWRDDVAFLVEHDPLKT